MELSVEDFNDFSQYLINHMNSNRQILAKYAGNSNLSVEDLQYIIQKKIDSGELTADKVNIF